MPFAPRTAEAVRPESRNLVSNEPLPSCNNGAEPFASWGRYRESETWSGSESFSPETFISWPSARSTIRATAVSGTSVAPAYDPLDRFAPKKEIAKKRRVYQHHADKK